MLALERGKTCVAAVMREESGGGSEGADRSANLAVQRIGTAAALLLQLGYVLQGKVTLAVRLRHKLGFDFGALSGHFHHILLWRCLSDRRLRCYLYHDQFSNSKVNFERKNNFPLIIHNRILD